RPTASRRIPPRGTARRSSTPRGCPTAGSSCTRLRGRCGRRGVKTPATAASTRRRATPSGSTTTSSAATSSRSPARPARHCRAGTVWATGTSRGRRGRPVTPTRAAPDGRQSACDSGPMTIEREISRPTALAHGRRLNPDAVGWSRRPVHHTALAGWGRTKRWEYWGVVTDSHVVGLTVAGLVYLATCDLYVLDGRAGVETSRSGVTPFGSPRFRDDPGDGTIHASAGPGPTRVGVDIDDDDAAGTTAIAVHAKGVRVELEVT